MTKRVKKKRQSRPLADWEKKFVQENYMHMTDREMSIALHRKQCTVFNIRVAHLRGMNEAKIRYLHRLAVGLPINDNYQGQQ